MLADGDLLLREGLASLLDRSGYDHWRICAVLTFLGAAGG